MKKYIEETKTYLLERVVSDQNMQSKVLNMSTDKLKTFEFILNYNATDKKGRLPNISANYKKT